MINNANVIAEAVSEIVLEADSLKEKAVRSDYEEGQLLAFASALDIIKSACSGYDLKEYGLDFDVDKRYLIS